MNSHFFVNGPLLIPVYSIFFNELFYIASLAELSNSAHKKQRCFYCALQTSQLYQLNNTYVIGLYEEFHLPCLLSSVGTGWIPNTTVFLIGSMSVRAVFNNCLAVGTPEPYRDSKKDTQ